MNLRQYRLLLLAFILWSAGATAAESAMDWLMKMNVAVQNKSYDGIFVYRHGDQLEAMRIVHRSTNGIHRERLVSLNGEAREIIRTDRDVICYLPTKNRWWSSTGKPARRIFQPCCRTVLTDCLRITISILAVVIVLQNGRHNWSLSSPGMPIAMAIICGPTRKQACCSEPIWWMKKAR